MTLKEPPLLAKFPRFPGDYNNPKYLLENRNLFAVWSTTELWPVTVRSHAMTSIPQSCLSSSLQTDAEALCLHPKQSSNQPVAQISIHTRAAIQTWVCLVRGTREMRTLPSCTATQGTSQHCHRHQWNASSCGYRWHMTVLILADASAAMSAVCGHTFINANLGDIYIQDVFQLRRTISYIHLAFPQEEVDKWQPWKARVLFILKTACCAISFQHLPQSLQPKAAQPGMC